MPLYVHDSGLRVYEAWILDAILASQRHKPSIDYRLDSDDWSRFERGR
jgi:hypothetical protein